MPPPEALYDLRKGPKAHTKLRNTQQSVYANFFEKFASFCLLPCDTSQEPNGNCSEKLDQRNFFILGDFFRVYFPPVIKRRITVDLPQSPQMMNKWWRVLPEYPLCPQKIWCQLGWWECQVPHKPFGPPGRGGGCKGSKISRRKKHMKAPRARHPEEYLETPSQEVMVSPTTSFLSTLFSPAPPPTFALYPWASLRLEKTCSCHFARILRPSNVSGVFMECKYPESFAWPFFTADSRCKQPRVGCVIAQAFFSRGASAISLKSRVFHWSLT